jgi:hypothetical protein
MTASALEVTILDKELPTQSQPLRARMCVQPCIGRIGVGMWASAPLPRVEVSICPRQLQITQTSRRWVPLGFSRVIEYRDIEIAQAVSLPWWLVLWLDHLPPPVGIRLNMGEWRSRVVLFDLDTALLLSSVEGRGVRVSLDPIRLNPLWIGRK